MLIEFVHVSQSVNTASSVHVYLVVEGRHAGAGSPGVVNAREAGVKLAFLPPARRLRSRVQHRIIHRQPGDITIHSSSMSHDRMCGLQRQKGGYVTSYVRNTD